MAWTQERLQELARARLAGARLVVVANREPFIHTYAGGEVRCMRPASGVATALDPVMQVCRGVWVGHGSGDADRATVDAHDRVAVPPDDPRYLLRRVWLTEEEEQGYYYGLANEALWPLCHNAYLRPQFNLADWEQYVRVNAKFAHAVLAEVGSAPAVVFVQDYHFALLPRMLKDARPDLVVAQFWHIPWPNREVMRVCPWLDALLDGLLGNDLLAFHIQCHCNNFLDTVDRSIEARVDLEHFSVTRGGKTTAVRPQPISIDPDYFTAQAPADQARREQELRHRLGVRDRALLVGVDRVDYIKGIPERLRAVDRLLTRYPLWRRRLHFVQVGAPSRVQITSYRQLNEEVAALVSEINGRHGDAAWQPVLFLREHHDADQLITLYRAAAACVVSSLHDGMNLVAKEFVASRSDLRGALVLSRFTGAARELTDALLVNPYAADDFADTLHDALTMPPSEQEGRMERLQRQVRDYNVYRWAGLLLTEAAQLLDRGKARPRAPLAPAPAPDPGKPYRRECLGAQPECRKR